MKFCTVINCMDGRVQLPANEYARKRFNADYVDTITEPGPNLILSDRTNHREIKSIVKRLDISINIHSSKGVAIVGHFNCVGNPACKDLQIAQLHTAMQLIQDLYRNVEVIGLWIDEQWNVVEISA